MQLGITSILFFILLCLWAFVDDMKGDARSQTFSEWEASKRTNVSTENKAKTAWLKSVVTDRVCSQEKEPNIFKTGIKDYEYYYRLWLYAQEIACRDEVFGEILVKNLNGKEIVEDLMLIWSYRVYFPSPDDVSAGVGKESPYAY